ncbi:hypothetical protein niasHS_015872 [Heterodera schachtii]|uniref:Uncharacterized protein n=1 Tax=Heterodera schachtii TaxID=97005 RepID=A0ABD2I1T7_HETSC
MEKRCNSEELLKICIKYEQSHSTGDTQRIITVNLSAIYLNMNLMSKDVQQNVQNGDKLDIPMPTNVREFDEFKFVFRIFVKPLDNEYQSGGFDEDPSDDQPFEDQYYQLQMDDIRSMVRSVGFVLYEPNFAKRYTFNLGQIDPLGLFWKRRIFLDTKNGGPGNFHGFLYATVNKNQRNLPIAQIIYTEKHQLRNKK